MKKSPASTIIFNEYTIKTPLGKLVIWLSKDNTLQFAGWPESKEETQKQLERYYNVKNIELQPKNDTNPIISIIGNYFKGDIKGIDTLTVASFGTAFQKKVWQALRNIPTGSTCSYSDIAKQIGKPLASRAVGMANHCNPIAIIVPCHRVIGKNNKLTGYAGGLDKKQWLLDHERHYSNNQ